MENPQEIWQAAKIALAGAFGALGHIYLRPPRNWIRGLIAVLFGIGQALIFTQLVADWLGWPPGPVGFVIGLTGKVLAGRALRAAENADLTLLLKRKD